MNAIIETFLIAAAWDVLARCNTIIPSTGEFQVSANGVECARQVIASAYGLKLSK